MQLPWSPLPSRPRTRPSEEATARTLGSCSIPTKASTRTGRSAPVSAAIWVGRHRDGPTRRVRRGPVGDRGSRGLGARHRRCPVGSVRGLVPGSRDRPGPACGFPGGVRRGVRESGVPAPLLCAARGPGRAAQCGALPRGCSSRPRVQRGRREVPERLAVGQRRPEACGPQDAAGSGRSDQRALRNLDH